MQAITIRELHRLSIALVLQKLHLDRCVILDASRRKPCRHFDSLFDTYRISDQQGISIQRAHPVHTRKFQDRHISFSSLDISFRRTHNRTFHKDNIPETSFHFVGELRGRGLDRNSVNENDTGCPFGQYSCEDLKLRWVNLLDVRV